MGHKARKQRDKAALMLGISLSSLKEKLQAGYGEAG